MSYLSSGMVEGLNRNVNPVTRKAYGYRTFNALEIALYHTLGNYPSRTQPTNSFKEANFNTSRDVS